jgi:hypothetical protein
MELRLLKQKPSLIHQSLMTDYASHCGIRRDCIQPTFSIFTIAAMGDTPNRFNTGDFVPETGIYRVAHMSHRLPHEVVIFSGDHFPKCAKCSTAVVFELVHAVSDLFQHTVRVMYELPVIEDSKDSEEETPSPKRA